MTETRVPPQDLDAERALLGAIMLKPNAMYDIADMVVSDSFYAAKHGDIFETMLALFNKGEPIDLVTLSGKLESRKKLDQVGGRGYLSELANAAPAATNAVHYAQVVKAKQIHRDLIEAAEHIGELGYQEDGEVDKLLDEAQSTIFQIANTSTLQKFVSIGDELKDAWKRLESLQENKDELRGIHTGFRELDNLLAGFQKSDLIILAARPSMGKTSLALDIARQTAIHHDNAVGIFSLEMSSQQLTDRMLAAEAKVNSWRLRTGKLSSDNEYERLRNGMDRLSSAPIYIDDKAERTVLQMRSIARRLKAEKGLSLVIVDYLQLIVPGVTRQSDSMVQQVTEISRSLKGMARELDVPVLALSQLSRAVEQRRDHPRLSDLRDSGSIEQDADVVMFIHREDKIKEDSDRPNIADIMVEKHRNGPVGRVELFFDDEKATFLSVEKSDFGDYAETATSADEAEF
ncbi:replicative DNA helicase [bacterium]|nr:replicative DNA helicase [bacterium]|tara:strand:- start:19345 stop:20724 length:1380 start_codon:yes stop_codon:yes gene_type:complete